MSVKVHLYSNLPNYADKRNLVEVKGTTIGECLSDLVNQFPGLKPELFDKEGKLLPDVFVSVNLKSPKPEQLDRRITEKDELYLILIVAGG